MIYKDFVAEAAQKIMAAAIADRNADGLNNDNEGIAEYARGSVNAAKALADALDQDWQDTPVDSIHNTGLPSWVAEIEDLSDEDIENDMKGAGVDDKSIEKIIKECFGNRIQIACTFTLQ